MKFLQDRRIMWGAAILIVVIVLAIAYGWPGGEAPPAQ
jgi:type III secretory pathway component EscS